MIAKVLLVFLCATCAACGNFPLPDHVEPQLRDVLHLELLHATTSKHKELQLWTEDPVLLLLLALGVLL